MNEEQPKRARRPRKTRRSVVVTDRIARLGITVVGVGTIAAVASLCVFLVWVVVPLFEAPRVESVRQVGPPPTGAAHVARALGTDENLAIGWSCSQAGEVLSFDLADGTELSRQAPFAEPPTALSISTAEGKLSFGFADGTLRTSHIGFETRFLDEDDVPAELAGLELGEARRHGSGIAERILGGQLRLRELSPQFDEPLAVEAGASLHLVDSAGTDSTPVHASLDEHGLLRISRVAERTNLLTGAKRITLTQGDLQLEFAGLGTPRWLGLTGLGDNAFLVWEDGSLWRIDAADLESMRVAEKIDAAPEPGARVGAVSFLVGRTTLVIGDSLGRVRAWFRTKPEDAGTVDGSELVLGQEIRGPASAVTALAASTRARLLAVGFADGSADLVHVTSGRTLLEVSLPGPAQAVTALALSPRDDALLVASAGARALWRIEPAHPETSLSAIFAPVWYEGFEHPEHTWQSTGGTDDFEPKYGMLPLVFGTLKATGYSLLFGVPLALLAAIYTSEFMHARHKARVKPAIEMMASLPSVVLGFLAALVIAPLVEERVPEVLAAIYLLPLSALLGGHLWGALPTTWTIRLERTRLAFVGLCLLAGLAAGISLGDALERLLFAGDMRAWLAGTIGRGLGGWVLILLPAVAAGVAWLRARWFDSALVSWSAARPQLHFGLLDLGVFALSCAVSVLLTWGLAAGLDSLGFDPRGGVLGTYVQRNALVVGFAMGFAIVPIIYTIAEDSLAAVPDHLRAASLGAGATPWQTAIRVVVPAAMSGIFSAVMVGLGRAVGETMIVLMAAGNTPIMDWNIFNGFRTLSANIAVEMPEAVQNSTHYRMLFLAALVLFAMTFALNTLAEIVRLRYRRRKVQL